MSVEAATTAESVYEAMTETDAIAARIIAEHLAERHRIVELARTAWLEDGIEIAAVRRHIERGLFEAWVETCTVYEIRTAQNVALAASMIAEHLGHANFALLPDIEKAAAYLLAAPSTITPIRDAFLPRLLAGEFGLLPQIQRALKPLRAERRAKAKRKSAPSSKVVDADNLDENVANLLCWLPPHEQEALIHVLARNRHHELLAALRACRDGEVVNLHPRGIYDPAGEIAQSLKARERDELRALPTPPGLPTLDDDAEDTNVLPFPHRLH